MRPRERDLEHTLRGYDDELHALDATEREKRIGDIATELFELRKAREESPSSEAEVVSAEFDVLFESHEKMAIDIAGQSLVVEKKQLLDVALPVAPSTSPSGGSASGLGLARAAGRRSQRRKSCAHCLSATLKLAGASGVRRDSGGPNPGYAATDGRRISTSSAASGHRS